MTDRLRARVLYYYARSQRQGRATLGPSSIAKLLDVPEDAARMTVERAGAELPDGATLRWTNGRATIVVGDTAGQADAATITRIFEAWLDATGRDGRSRLTADRRGVIAARLRDGYSEADIVAAIHGLASSPWHRGDNPRGRRYDDLRHALGDGAKLEGFRDATRARRPVEPARPVAETGVLIEVPGMSEDEVAARWDEIVEALRSLTPEAREAYVWPVATAARVAVEQVRRAIGEGEQ